LVKKEAPIKRGRRKTGTVAVVETEEKQQDSATSEAHSLENIEETGESVEKKPQASKRGRRKAVVVNSEDVSTAIEAVGATARNESESTAEIVTAEEPAKPTLGRRASLRTRPAVVSTPKEVPMKKTRQVKTIEEDPVKTPVKAKVTRRNSVAVPKSKPTASNSELADENAAVEEETGATELKEAKKPPKSRRQTIAVASEKLKNLPNRDVKQLQLRPLILLPRQLRLEGQLSQLKPLPQKISTLIRITRKATSPSMRKAIKRL